MELRPIGPTGNVAMRHHFSPRGSRFHPRRLLACAALALAAAMIATPAQAVFHLNGIEELYTDATGTLQFIQLHSTPSGQQNVGGRKITVFNVDGTQAHVLTLPNNLPGDTADKHWLIGTAGIDAAGAPAPDFIMPDNFLFIAGGNILYFGLNSGPYSALPTDGTMAREFGTSNNVPNVAENFAGATGSVVVPVVVPGPATALLLAIGIGTSLALRRRRRR